MRSLPHPSHGWCVHDQVETMLFCIAVQLVTHFKRWRIEDYSAVIRSVTPEQLTAFLPRLMRRCFLEALAVGNVAPEEAVGLVQGALKKLEEGEQAADEVLCCLNGVLVLGHGCCAWQ